MNKRVRVSADGETITVHIPLTFRKRGGRKVDNATGKALARAFRWRKMLDEGMHAMIEDLAKSKGMGKTYVSKISRLGVAGGRGDGEGLRGHPQRRSGPAARLDAHRIVFLI